jgi:hypothetical protein
MNIFLLLKKILHIDLKNIKHTTYSDNEIFKAMAVFYKIVKLVKNGVLMIIHIYAKVSYKGYLGLLLLGLFLNRYRRIKPQALPTIDNEIANFGVNHLEGR